MSSTPDNPTDDELSEIIDDSESVDQSKIDEDGLVEAGIPPSVAEETEEPDSDDESFSIDDLMMQMSKNPLKKMSAKICLVMNRLLKNQPKGSFPGSSSHKWEWYGCTI